MQNEAQNIFSNGQMRTAVRTATDARKYALHDIGLRYPGVFVSTTAASLRWDRTHAILRCTCIVFLED